MENVRVGLHFLNRRKLKSGRQCHSKYFRVGLDFEVAWSCSYFNLVLTKHHRRIGLATANEQITARWRLPAMDVLATKLMPSVRPSVRPYARHRPRVLGHSPPADQPAADGHADDTGART